MFPRFFTSFRMTKGVNKQIISRKYGKIYQTGSARHEEDGRTEGVLPHESGTQHRLSGVYPEGLFASHGHHPW